eukprot:1086243-Rhodomonas_salina.2
MRPRIRRSSRSTSGTSMSNPPPSPPPAASTPATSFSAAASSFSAAASPAPPHLSRTLQPDWTRFSEDGQQELRNNSSERASARAKGRAREENEEAGTWLCDVVADVDVSDAGGAVVVEEEEIEERGPV